MRIYLAAPWVRKDEARATARIIESAGHTITKRWWEHREVPGYGSPDCTSEGIKELEQQAAEDVHGVLTADAFILLNLEKSEGKAFESGIAYTAGIPIYIVGDLYTNLFQYFPDLRAQRYPTIQDVLAALNN